MTKLEKLTKILKANRDLCHSLKDYYREKGDEKTADEYLTESTRYSYVLYLLEDEKFLNTQFKILVEKENK